MLIISTTRRVRSFPVTDRQEENGTGPADDRTVGKYTMSVTVRLTGAEAHRIRKYEESGLLMPKRTEGGQRLYSDDEIALIKEIAGLEEEGINLQGIKAIVAMRRGERQ
jgi:hypothetical protein